MKTFLGVLEALVLTSVLITLVGIFTKHIVVEQVLERHVINVVNENHETMFQMEGTPGISYRVAFTK